MLGLQPIVHRIETIALREIQIPAWFADRNPSRQRDGMWLMPPVVGCVGGLHGGFPVVVVVGSVDNGLNVVCCIIGKGNQSSAACAPVVRGFTVADGTAVAML